jgi:glycosyltransferase involved in cell wall biosynthesis
MKDSGQALYSKRSFVPNQFTLSPDSALAVQDVSAGRKLLLVNHYFPPSAECGAFRMLGLVRHLMKYGWHSVVVTPNVRPLEARDPNLLQAVPRETVIYRVAYPQGHVARLLTRYVPYYAWLPRAISACKRAIREHRPDALSTSSPPHCVHLLGLYFKIFHGLPWIADFRDPWTTGRDMPPLTRRVSLKQGEADLRKHLEQAVMRHADAVVSNTPLGEEALKAAYPAYADKVFTVTNGFDPERFAEKYDSTPGDGTLRILHTGEVYNGRDPRPLFDAIRASQFIKNLGPAGLRVRFLGRADFPASFSANGLGTIVETPGQVPYNQVVQEMMHADILLLLYRPGRRVGVPAKLYEYLGTGRPILALAENDGDIAWVLRKSNAVHRIARPNDQGSIQVALEELLQEAKKTKGAAPGRGCLRFTREHMAQQMAEILDRCVE